MINILKPAKNRKLFVGFSVWMMAMFAVAAQGQQYDVLHHFLLDPANPYAGLIQASDGNFYGTTHHGGSFDRGTAFKIDASGEVTMLHDFGGGSDGGHPYGLLIQGSDGNLYGTAFDGGTGPNFTFLNKGTVYKITPSGTFTRIRAFTGLDGANPAGGLLLGSDGDMYGTTTKGGAFDQGTVFKIDTQGNMLTLYSFGGTVDGANPHGELIQGSDDNFYGTTLNGGPFGRGTVYKMDFLGAVTTLRFFNGIDGANPYAALVEGSDGNFYGTTYNGGTFDMGTVFAINSAGAVLTVRFFSGTDGAHPYGSLVEASDGNFYGTTVNGGATDKGTVFRLDSVGAITTVHSFSETGSNGINPHGGLIKASDGNFYGTTWGGGASGEGVVFKMTSAGAVTTVQSFIGNDGAYPYAGLIQANDGNFYGSTLGGPTKGTVFRMDAAGRVRTLQAFTEIDGEYPYGGVTQANDGNFYGTTLSGGTFDHGTVFKMDPAGVVTTLHSFAENESEGGSPYTGLVQGNDGLLYGTTWGGGTARFGTAFKISLAGAFTHLRSFTGSDGSIPLAPFIQGSDGSFYSTTAYGGATPFWGTVFKMDSSGAVTTLHTFSGSDGANSRAAMFEASDGNFYGTTQYGGGPTDSGAVFKMDASGNVTKLHSFVGSNGAYPHAPPVEASNGYFYGTTFSGGANSAGTVFQIDPSGTVTTLHSFNGADGANPYAWLIQAEDGNLYGAAYNGGKRQRGVIFRISELPPPQVTLESVVSRKIHGSTGSFDIDLPITGPSGIECRSGGANGDHTMVFTFTNPLTSVGGASVTSGTGSVSSSSIDADPHQYIVNLTGVTNAQTVTVELSAVQDDTGASGVILGRIDLLLGDTNSNGAVNASDISQTKSQSGQTATATNFRTDVNINGVINASDISTVKSRSGTALP